MKWNSLATIRFQILTEGRRNVVCILDLAIALVSGVAGVAPRQLLERHQPLRAFVHFGLQKFEVVVES